MMLNPSLSRTRTRLAIVSVVTILATTHCLTALAATRYIPATVSTVDCRTYDGGIAAGDALVLRGTSRGPISFVSCRGTAAAPITIRNDSSEAGPLLIQQSGSGFMSGCTDCEHVVIDGSGKWANAPAGSCGITASPSGLQRGTTQCGIVLRCVSGSPHSSLRFDGSSRNFTVTGIEIDGNFPTCTLGMGLSINDHDYDLAAHPGEWREGIRLKNNYIHDTMSAGIYFGGNVNPAKPGSGDIPLRNNEIAYNYLNKLGCDGIKYKNAIAGASSIHHNYVTNTGQSTRPPEDGCTSAGIMLFESGYTDVHSNYVESPSPNSSGAGTCITQQTQYLPATTVATVPVRIFNNVVHNCKGAGIASGRRDTTLAAPTPEIYNNTIVAPIGSNGISVGSAATPCQVRDNIVAGTKISAGQCVEANNSVGTVEAQLFRDVKTKDFRISSSSPARNKGTSKCPAVDQLGTVRPQQGACDQGAFELSDNEESGKPNPPAFITVD